MHTLLLAGEERGILASTACCVVAAVSKCLEIPEAALKSSSASRIISLRCFSNISGPNASMSSRS
jgi:hypothetical protein